jgi:hypothetical protein
MIPKSGVPVFGQDHAQKILFILFTKFKTKPRGISAGLFFIAAHRRHVRFVPIA